jgi:hypothetical protein
MLIFELNTKNRLVRLFIFLSMAAVISACGNTDAVKTTVLNGCVENGIAYYKEIGSYPTLTSAGLVGRRAEDVVEEKCSRSAMAFPAKP